MSERITAADRISQRKAEEFMDANLEGYDSLDAEGQEQLLNEVDEYTAHMESAGDRSADYYEAVYDGSANEGEYSVDAYYNDIYNSDPNLRRANMLAQSVAEKRANGGSEEDIKAIEDKIEDILNTYAGTEGADPTVIDRIMDATVQEAEPAQTQADRVEAARQKMTEQYEGLTDAVSEAQKIADREVVVDTPKEADDAVSEIDKAQELADQIAAERSAAGSESTPEQDAEENEQASEEASEEVEAEVGSVASTPEETTDNQDAVNAVASGQTARKSAVKKQSLGSRLKGWLKRSFGRKGKADMSFVDRMRKGFDNQSKNFAPKTQEELDAEKAKREQKADQ